MIQSTSFSDPTGRARDLAGIETSRGTQSTAKRESLSTASNDYLRSALTSLPEIRTDMVARGMALASDPEYPSAEVIQKVSALIVGSPDLAEDLG